MAIQLNKVMLFVLSIFFISAVCVAQENVDRLKVKAEAGDVYAQSILGRMYVRGENGVTRDYEQALRWLAEAAEHNQPLALYNLGFLYNQGFGVEKDADKASQLFAKCFNALLEKAETADPQWQFDLSELYRGGLGGIEKNPHESIKWRKKSAEKGYVLAQISLVVSMVYESDGLPQNEAEAKKLYLRGVTWCEEAIKRDNVLAQGLLGFFYLSGKGVERDTVKGVELITKAAERGNNFAQFQLGMIYQGGHSGIETNLLQAKRWLAKAAEQGNNDATKELSKLENKLKFNYEDMKNEAAKHKNETLVFKSFYLGMDISVACDLVNHYFGTELNVETLEQSRKGVFYEVTVDYSDSDMATRMARAMYGGALGAQGIVEKEYDLLFTADKSQQVTSIYFRGKYVDKLFNSADMDAEAFTQEFMNSYNVSSMEPYHSTKKVLKVEPFSNQVIPVDEWISGYEYMDSKGWKLRISENKDIQLIAVPKKIERKFD